MANKEDKTLEQLKAELEKAQKTYEAVKKLTEQKEKEEAERKRAELAAERDSRQKEIEEAEKHYLSLIKKFIEDYGNYEMTNSYEDSNDFISFLFGSHPWKLFL